MNSVGVWLVVDDAWEKKVSSEEHKGVVVVIV